MSVDLRELEDFGRKLQAMKDRAPELMAKLAVGEGVYAAGQAKRICKADGIVNMGTYRENFHAGNRDAAAGSGVYDGSPVQTAGDAYSIEVYNNLDYAGHLEYGFRSHFVPGYWEGHTFVYQPGYPGGMYVGPYNGFVPGHFTLQRAIRQTEATQDARLGRKVDKFLREGLQ